ncbi:mechanosensitive ion channel family protein [Croceicoccus gelatinilyticus]|uniref:mechanosensitive ion channel family protein n=1 Tax=Croceicoccus gelatinilyticus TaxID=2835536 RepID=UPI001BCA85BC|nr:mechanosensitive ion channel domain-containing protein [Croceicoccus gelatinilyticus]MBS7670356.1 mechanosensitive ion channel [Croceicoccus gelatinilyticus]
MIAKTAAIRLSQALVFLVLALLASLALVAPAFSQSGGSSSEPYVYEVDSINPGLRTTFSGSQNDTPQALMEAFMEAGRNEDWRKASGALDLSYLPVSEQAGQGPELARKLHSVLKRAMTIDWAGLPDRPDAVDVTSSDKNPMAGIARRNLMLARVSTEDRSVSIRMHRLKVDGGEPVWLFASQTVENVPALYKRFGPTKFEQKMPPWLRAPAFWTLAWWEVIAIPLVLLIALLAAAGTWVAIRTFCRRYGETLPGRILAAMKAPAAILAFAGTFAVVRRIVFTFSGAVNTLLDPLQTLLIVIALAALFLAVIEAILDMVADSQIDDLGKPDHEKDRNYYTTLSAVRRIIIVLLILLGIGIVLIQTNMTDTLGFSLLAGAGMFSLVLAFAARKMLSDIMASMQIAFAKTARIGDAVEFNGEWCYVEKIGFTHLRLRTWDDRRIMAPVASFVQSSFENWTKQDASLLKLAHLRLDHRADVDALRKEFAKFVEDEDGICDKENAKIQVVDHDASGMWLRMIARSPDPATGWDMHCRMREYMLAAAARLDAAAGNEPAPAYLPREREVRIDLADKG